VEQRSSNNVTPLHQSTADEGSLYVRLDAPLPGEVAVGRGTALFVCGWCFHHNAEIRALSFVVDGELQPVMAHGMPRLDPFVELDEPRSYRSGFWGMVRICAGSEHAHDGGPEHPHELDLMLRADLDTGDHATARLARLGLVRSMRRPARVAAPNGEGPLVAICIATHNPPAELLAAQLDSIRAQTHENWVCLVSDDCSSPEAFRLLRSQLGDDPRFVLDRSPRRLGFYRNFERALSMVPPVAQFVALADQDDRWYEDKIATLLARIGDAELAYSDARVVSRDGRVISDTYWSRRRNNHSSLLSVLVANSVTGAASLFRRELLDFTLPFPPAQFAHYHDHWLAVTTLALGEIEFVDRPLYDYVQHGAASLGHATANQMPALRERLSSLRTRAPRDRIRKWRMHYFVDVARLWQFATVLQLRCGTRMSRRRRRTIEQWLGAERSASMLVTLAVRGVRELVGRPETLGAEWMLFGALVWRRLLTLTARPAPQRWLRLDAVPPPSLAPGPLRFAAIEGSAPRAIADKIAPLTFEPSAGAPRRINLLIPTIDLDHLFAGYIGMLNLALRLSDRHARVRIVTVDPTPRLPPDWQRRLESYAGLAGLGERVEVVFGRESSAVEISDEDSFIATTWWTAHIARRTLADVRAERFVYLIQEYEPFTFPMGTYAALARESYDAPHFALFSSELLRDYFRGHRIGVYDGGAVAGDAISDSFQNAITPVRPPTLTQLRERRTRGLLFYARPEPHAARNMFELGVLALSTALRDGAFQDGWELRGIGSVGSTTRLALGGGAQLELLPRTDQRTYGRLLARHDLGLALMYTPHPSLVPIEMAAAGMFAVTNSFECKTPAAMAAISSNLITAEPTIESVAAALSRAAIRVSEAEGRVEGSAVRWSRDWRESFDDRLLARVESWLAS
jgi:glycosyltransferase involved in cell wall biosynthesis